MVNCDFNVLREHDMDVLLAEAFATDPAFLTYFLNHAQASDQHGTPCLLYPEFKVAKVELSKKDRDGESDITVIISDGEKRVGLLIEDKIDAPAQPEQSERYQIRGKTRTGTDFDAFHVFIVCPKKYRESNEEAGKYPYCVSYERICEYYTGKNYAVSLFRRQQIEQAIRQARKAAEVVINETAHSFFEKYHDYVNEHYPKLRLRTSRNLNGYWPRYSTEFGKSYIYHKMNENADCVDYTFPNAKKYRQQAEFICDWLRRHGVEKVQTAETGDAIALRISVPPLRYNKSFEEQIPDLKECLEAVKTFAELAAVMSSGELLIGK